MTCKPPPEPAGCRRAAPRGGGAPSGSPRASRAGLWLVAILLLAGGCAQKYVTLRSAPHNPLRDDLQLASWSGPQPSRRTVQLLRVYNLTDGLAGDPRPLLDRLQQLTDREPSADKVYALSELAYLGAKRTEAHDSREAMDLYGASVLHAYAYLFDDRFAATRNCYDMQFRGACDLYNSALESALRIISKNHELLPGMSKTIHTAAGTWDLACVLRGGNWQPQDFERFEFVSDYEMKGLRNLYLTHGLGVPLIAVRRSYPGEPAAARYYPGSLSFPVTALLRPLPQAASPGRNQGLLELYDPLVTTETQVGHLTVPLESDLTTPLAYFLSKIPINTLATAGFLAPEKLLTVRPDRKAPITGLYMAQPYEPGKIPVLMVHGIWSSPMTWMEMFNDLRSSPDIRRHYQFWFYLYPTAQPFWLSAAQLRRDLDEVRQVLDPGHVEPALDQMVLVGHSMGGLVAKLQTIDSGGDYWRLASQVPLEQVRASAEAKQKLSEVFFFRPNPSIRRVVMIATPHHGSQYFSQTTQYVLDKLIRMPATLANSRQELFRDNQGLAFAGSLLRVETSLDALSPASPIFPLMLAARRPPWVRYHNIVGQKVEQWWKGPLQTAGDGVVTVASARLEGAESELVVPAEHMTIHAQPAVVLEVRRILNEHLAELRGAPIAAAPPAAAPR
ncbi:MAG: alpha/beta fold hydrolase [Thermoguttaceae bacterium]|jgi:pimeloyl-ACP methyl ester carboxylesterase